MKRSQISTFPRSTSYKIKAIYKALIKIKQKSKNDKIHHQFSHVKENIINNTTFKKRNKSIKLS